MREPEVVNYIEIDGKDVEIDSMDTEEAAKMGWMIQDHLMAAAGYRRAVV